MYGFDWIERLRKGGGNGTRESSYRVSPVVYSLGLTSLLTDISSEMVTSLLPLYLVLHLHLSPLQFGAIDGVYNGFATLLVALAAGWYADRANRRKEVAAIGYGLSAACKVLLIVAGGAWGTILLVTGIDRVGKGLRSAPRDALISMHTPADHYAAAFGIHRAMDAAGALMGPLVAFLLIAAYPSAFEMIWLVSFVFAALGVAAIVMLVPSSRATVQNTATVRASRAAVVPKRALMTPRFALLLACAALLSVTTISDGFIYLLLQQQFVVSAGYMPLFPVATAASYMLFAIPASRLADRTGRTRVLLSGYAMLVVLYVVVTVMSPKGMPLLLCCLILLGLYYAATEGVLVALASRELVLENRTYGIAMLATAVGVGKMISSVLFGWLWTGWSHQVALTVFLLALPFCCVAVGMLLRKWND